MRIYNHNTHIEYVLLLAQNSRALFDSSCLTLCKGGGVRCNEWGHVSYPVISSVWVVICMVLFFFKERRVNSAHHTQQMANKGF
jgi:hypothetical protein